MSGERFSIIDLETGNRVDVEAIHGRRDPRTDFGESLAEHCRGSIRESDSRITEDTHRNVRFVGNPSEAWPD